MNAPRNVTPLRRLEPAIPEEDTWPEDDAFDPADYEGYAYSRIARMRTSRNGREAQLWLCLEADETLTLKWMAPTPDPDHFEPLALGSISLEADELGILADLFQTSRAPVAKLLAERKALR